MTILRSAGFGGHAHSPKSGVRGDGITCRPTKKGCEFHSPFFLRLCIFYKFFLLPFHPALEIGLIPHGYVGELDRKGHQSAGDAGADVKLAPVVGNAGYFIVFHRHVEGTEGNMVVRVNEGPGHGHQQLFLADEGHRIVNAVDAPQGAGHHHRRNNIEYDAMVHVMGNGKNYGACTDEYINKGQKNNIQF